LAHYQEELCGQLGWPTPTNTAKKYITYLTRLLLNNTPNDLNEDTEEWKTMLQLFAEPVHELRLSDESLEKAWSWINLRMWNQYERPTLLGSRVISMMIDSLVDRIQRPGRAAIPYKYLEHYEEHFPLPYILYNGNYFFEKHSVRCDSGLPFRNSWLGFVTISTDCIHLAALKRLVSASANDKSTPRPRCGLIELSTVPSANCFYTNLGFGCPQIGLSESEKLSRDDSKIGNWCHWVAVNKHIGLID
jgi:hypothetical protein